MEDAGESEPTATSIPQDVPSSQAVLSLNRGRAFLVGAAVLWSLSGIIIKSPPIQEIPLVDRSLVLACYRGLFAAAALLPFVRWRRVRLRFSLVPSVTSFALMNVLYVAAFTRTTAGAAACLQYTSTVWVFLFGWLALKERVHRGNVIALLCSISGIAWILFSEQDGQRAEGNALALGSGLAYAGVILSLRWLRAEEPTWVTVVNHAVSGLALLPLVLPRHIELSALQWSLVAVLGLFQMGVPYVFAARGIALLNVQESALLVLLEPILIPVWAWLCWGEAIGRPTLIGGGLILGGLALRYALWPDRQN